MIVRLLDRLDETVGTLRRALIRRLSPPKSDAERIADMFDLPRSILAGAGTYQNAAQQAEEAEEWWATMMKHHVERWALVVDADTDPQDAYLLWEANAREHGWNVTEDCLVGIQKNQGTGELLVEGDVVR